MFNKCDDEKKIIRLGRFKNGCHTYSYDVRVCVLVTTNNSHTNLKPMRMCERHVSKRLEREEDEHIVDNIKLIVKEATATKSKGNYLF